MFRFRKTNGTDALRARIRELERELDAARKLARDRGRDYRLLVTLLEAKAIAARRRADATEKEDTSKEGG